MPETRDTAAYPASAIPVISRLLVWCRGLMAVLGLMSAGALLQTSGYTFHGRQFADRQATWYVAITVAAAGVALLTLAMRRLERKIERHVRYLGSIDALTGLPNRTILMERLAHENVAALYLDLDHFKMINDSLGHEVGDEVLKIVSQRLRRAIRQSDLVVRLGGDEFVIVVEDTETEKVAEAAAMLVLEALRPPLRVDHRELFVSCSIGIAVKCPQLQEATELMRAADLALYRAKRQGRDQRVLFNDTMESNVLEQLDLESDLWRAIERDEMEVHYQPEVSMETGQIAGFEALVRWRHPQLGLLKPARFIGLAEENGALREIGLWVLEQACRQWRHWQELFPSSGKMVVSVNLSARQLEQADLVDRIEEILTSTGMDPQSLKLEITESVMLNDAPSTLGMLLRLRAMGVKLAIDDFGTGYSSLNYLKQLPVQSVKIDQSFVRHMEDDDANLLIVQAIVTLAHDLGLDVTAAGVETRKQLEFISQLGCDRGQGFYLAEPLPKDSIDSMLRAYIRHVPSAEVA